MKRPHEADNTGDEDEDEDIVNVDRESRSSGRTKTSFVRCGPPSTQVMARKKRRGIIEKRRRDRINTSLSELRRLVPTAVEKQGSAKLEKAEVLQMTVDHLKMLQATGGKGFLDAQVMALDFLSLGSRECMMEVSRYLSTVEGVDSADLLQYRLLSHLASCASQQDAAAQMAASQLLPPPLHPWVAALHSLPYGRSGLLVSPDVGPHQRPGEVLHHSVASSSSFLLPCPLPSLPPSFPVALYQGFSLLPSSSFTSMADTSPPPAPANRTDHEAPRF